MTCDSCFTTQFEVFTNHILAENAYFLNNLGWPEHKIMVLKPTNKYKFIQKCHSFKNIFINNLQHHPILYHKKFGKHIFFGAENNKMVRQDN